MSEKMEANSAKRARSLEAENADVEEGVDDGSSSKRSKTESAPISNVLPIDEERFKTLEPIEQAKLRAAYNAVDEVISDHQVVGIGSGSTIVYVVERIAQRVKAEGLSLTCIPTSYQARELIRINGLTLSDLATHPDIDVTIDGADEITADMVCIKGGGGCHLQEKIIASCSKKMVIVCDFTKVSQKLGSKWKKGVPVEIVPLATQPIINKIKAFGGNAILRMAAKKAGPVITDNGNFILDVIFGELTGDKNPELINAKLQAIVGVIETGLFIGMVHKAYVGTDYGTVEFMST